MRPVRLLLTFLALAAALPAGAQPSEDITAPEGPAAVVDGLHDLAGQEWVVNDCANRWTEIGSLSVCAVHDCATLYLLFTTSNYSIDALPLYVAFDLDGDGVAFAPGDLALTSAGGWVRYGAGGAHTAAARGVYAVAVQPESGELQMEASLPLEALGLAPGASVPYTFGQAALPPEAADLATLTVGACGGPTPEVVTPQPWPTEYTYEMFVEKLRAEEEAQRAQPLATVLALAVAFAALGLAIIIVFGLRRRR